MIKGINKQVLEVTNPESPYFDKILFFVSPNGSSAGEDNLKNEAQKIAHQATKPPKFRRSRKERFLNALYIACGIGAGAALAVILGTVI